MTDFDAPVDRTGTHSFKWAMYPEGVLPLWVADMDFPAPPAAVAALEQRAAHGVYGYTVVPDSLVAAIRRHLASCYGWAIESDWLVWLPGVVPGLNMVCRAFARPDEAIMTVTPAYPPFLEAPRFQDRRLQTVPAVLEDGRWRLPLAAMEAAVTPATRVLLFCHPHNPLGRAWEREEVAAVTEFCRRHNLVLCSDEIHCDLILDPVRHAPSVTVDPSVVDRSVTLMSPSKTFNLPGLNFAFAVIPDGTVRRRFTAAGDGLLPFAGCFAVAAAEAAYREGDAWVQDLLEYLRGNRDLVERLAGESLPGVTMTHVEATYLAWLDARGRGLVDPAKACRQAGVALSDGAPFGAPGFLRLNFACPRSTLGEALVRMQSALG